MKKAWQSLFHKYQNVTLFISILLLSGMVVGGLFSIFINVNDVTAFSAYLSAVNESVDKYVFFIEQFGSSIAFVGIVLLLGSSVIGIPLISFILFSKGLQIGFSCALFIYTYSLKGVIGILIALLPQVLFDVIISFLASACGIQLSLYLMHTTISKDRLDMRRLCNQLLSNLCVISIFVLIGAYMKSTVVIELIRLFNLL